MLCEGVLKAQDRRKGALASICGLIAGNEKRRPQKERRLIAYKGAGLLEAKTGVFVFELGNAAASVHEARVAACPCWVNRRVDIERHLIALFAPSRFHLHNRTVCHFDVDRVVFGMDIFFHLPAPYASAPLESGL
ncbi:MAG: hypothetical protein ACJA06_001190 [Halocynthiibacter sp.]|jgi:hypothetical protein